MYKTKKILSPSGGCFVSFREVGKMGAFPL